VKEVDGNLWEIEADWRVITTNGFVKKDGRAVMGRGVARQALQRYPGIDRLLGNHLRRSNRVHVLSEYRLISMPVKYNWWEDADPDLIERSARELAAWADTQGDVSVVLPRPGCGNGGLLWSQVKPLIEDILDDRFTVVYIPSYAP